MKNETKKQLIETGHKAGRAIGQTVAVPQIGECIEAWACDQLIETPSDAFEAFVVVCEVECAKRGHGLVNLNSAQHEHWEDGFTQGASDAFHNQK